MSHLYVSGCVASIPSWRSKCLNFSTQLILLSGSSSTPPRPVAPEAAADRRTPRPRRGRPPARSLGEGREMLGRAGPPIHCGRANFWFVSLNKEGKQLIIQRSCQLQRREINEFVWTSQICGQVNGKRSRHIWDWVWTRTYGRLMLFV